MLMMASASLDDSTHTNSRTVAPSKKKQVSLVAQTTTAIMISRSFVAEEVLASRVLCCLASFLKSSYIGFVAFLLTLSAAIISLDGQF